MKTSIHLIEQIIRAKTALHLKLVAHRNGGKVEIGGGRVDDLLAEVDAGLSSYERMLVRWSRPKPTRKLTGLLWFFQKPNRREERE